jgi:hypothetical protein
MSYCLKMYKDIETDISYEYLKIVISELKEPICILGGWAVFFTVNEIFKQEMSRNYLGSKDIDIGFYNFKCFKEAADILEKRLKFEPVAFRYFKAIHAETGKDLTEEKAKSLPQHMIFNIYVDPIFSSVNEELKIDLGFSPIDEPLLKEVFENGKYKKVNEFGKNLFLPAPEIILATKLKSAPERNKEHKKTKDMCDIIALCLFSGAPFDKIIAKAKSLISKEKFNAFLKMDIKDKLAGCSNILGLEENVVHRVFDKIKE